MPFTALDLSTEATQADVLTNVQSQLVALQNILTELTTGTLAVDSATLATSLGQDTGNSTLTALLGELGQKVEPGDLSTLATTAKQDSAKTVLDNILAGIVLLEGYVDGLETNTAGLAKSDVAVTLTDGRKTVATPGTAVALRATLACKWVAGNALFSNTQQVNVGGSGVLAASGSTTGRGLLPGASFSFPVSDAALLFVDARVAGEGVSFTVGS